MKRWLWMIVLLLALTQIGSSQSAKSGLTRLLDAQLARFPAKAGVYVKHLKSGEEAAVRGDEEFSTRSVIKIPILILAFQLAEQKKLNLDHRVEVRKEDMRSGSGVLSAHDPGLNPTIRDVITEMIITSDNTATDIMISQVGGVDRVNEWISKAGYTKTKLLQTIDVLFKKRDVMSSRSPNPTREEMITRELDRSNWLGVTTPREMGRMLEGIEQGTIASKQSCEEMKRIMRRQQAGARRIPHFLDVPVAHKTGDGPPTNANDVGMVYAHSGPIIISFFTTDNRGPFAELEDQIGYAARLIVDYFDGAPSPR